VHGRPDSSENVSMKPWRLAGRSILAAATLLALATGVPEGNQFRGPEEVSDFDNPPAPTEGQGATHTDAVTEIACRGPRVSRPAAVVCHPR
jgi:hypothetical protein